MEAKTALKDILLILPLIILFLTSLLPIMIKFFFKQKEVNTFSYLLIVFTGFAICVGFLVIPQKAHLIFDRALMIDSVSRFIGVLVMFLSGASLFLVSENENFKNRHFAETIFLIVNATLGANILIWGNDLLTVFVGLELMSLSLYILIAMGREKILSKEAAIKYFILGSFTSAFFLLGVSLIFGSAHNINFSDLAVISKALIDTNRLYFCGLILIILSFTFKISIFPFHMWTPDIYQGAPTPLSAFMATVVKSATVIAFSRFIMASGLWGAPQLIEILQWLAVGTMLVGNIAAIGQENFKRMLAYSSIAHSGYLMVGLIVGGYTGGQNSSWLTALVFYLMTYSFMTFAAFAIINWLEKNEQTFIKISDLSGMARRHPWLAMALTIILLSLAGIPPTLGFFGKFYLFSSAINEGLYWLAIWGVIGSVISVYYYLRPIVVIYMKDDLGFLIPKMKYLTKLSIAFFVLMVIVLGLASSSVFSLILHE